MRLQSETGKSEPLGDLGFTLFLVGAFLSNGISQTPQLKQQWELVKNIESDVRMTSEGNRASQHKL